MKIIKILGWGFVSLLAIGVIGIAILAIPAVQRAIVVRTLEGNAGREVQIERLRLGLGSLRAEGVSLREGLDTYEIGNLDLNFSLRPLLLSRELHLGNVNVRNLSLSLVRIEPPDRSDETEEGDGPERTEFPDFLVRMDAARLRGDGEVRLQVDGEEGMQRIRFLMDDDNVWFSRELVAGSGGAGAEEEYVLLGERLEGVFLAGGEGGDLFFQTEEPFVVMPVALRVNNVRLLSGGSFLAELSARQSAEGWQAQVAPVLFSDERGDVVRLDLELVENGTGSEVRGAFKADIASLMRQPALEPFNNVRAGRVELTFEGEETAASFTGSVQGVVRGLVSEDSGDGLPSLDFSADVEGALAAAFIRGKAPLVLRNDPEISDLNLDFEYRWDQFPAVFTAEVESGYFDLGGAEAFLSAFQVESADEEAEEDLQATILGVVQGESAREDHEPDAVPFWSGLTGGIRLSLNEVAFKGQSFLQDVVGAIDVTEGALSPEVQGTVYGGLFLMRGDVAFEAGEGLPYHLDGVFEIGDLDVVRIFREMDPGADPLVEGLVSLGLDVRGQGASLEDLVNSVNGRFFLNGQDGVFYGLADENPLADFEPALDLLGRAVPAAQRINEIAAYFQAIRFDQLVVQAGWDEDLNITIENLLVRAADIHLSGSGLILSRDGVSLLRQPMELELTLGARGRVGGLLDRTGLLAQQADPQGYRTFHIPFTLRGMLSDVDASPFYRMLAEALLSPALPFDLPFDLPFGGRREPGDPREEGRAPRQGSEIEDRVRGLLEGLFR